jgi:Zn finger protein HypA/HybF involved in hydrogenase expression
MKVACPTCGAEVEFRYDDSFVRVCGHCRSAVVRTDRGAETLGQFADLMPIESPLRLFAGGRYGTTGFLLVGMAQLRHASGGVWQEWYAKLDGGQWAWISEAQGRLYFTFERPDVPVPSIAALAPGAQVGLAGGAFTVAERGTATYVSALGEIPYRLVPMTTFQFADLSDGRGGFATIDYGDGSEAPAVYLGYQVTPRDLGLTGGEAAQAAPAQAPSGARLACPNCNGSLELRAPDQTLRIACPYCGSLISVEGGALQIIAQQAKKPELAIPLGTTGKFLDGEMTVIGFVGRSAYLDDTWFPFEEYLLYAPAVGFRWLVCSDGHWSYVQPVATGAVSAGVGARYDGVAFRRYQNAVLRVDSVLGELYWRVQAGERVNAEDYIAPPAMLSREVSADEQNWSLSTYMTRDQVGAAFGKPLKLPPPVGVAPNQPYGGGLGKVWALVTAAFFAVGIAKCASAPDHQKLHQSFSVPKVAIKPATTDPLEAGSGASEPAGTVMFSEKFQLEGGRNVAFDLRASLNNNWLYAALDLVNDDTGSVVSIDKSIEYYSGYDSDGSWSEGSTSAGDVIGPVQAGTYVLRVEAQQGGTGDRMSGSGAVDLDVTIRQGVFRGAWFWTFFLVLMIPFAIVGMHAYSFRKRRWENSNIGSRSTPGDDSSDDDSSGGSDDD